MINKKLKDNNIEIKFNDNNKEIIENKFDEKFIENYKKYIKWFTFTKNIEKLKEKLDENTFKDILLQISNIKSVLSKSKKELSKVSVYLELNPIKICFMGNYFEESCLGFYNTTKNFYSVFSNEIDLNKLVYYVEDNFGNIIGRVLCCFTKNKELIRFKFYSKSNLDAVYPLNEIFNKYITKLTKKHNIQLSNIIEKNDLGNIENLNNCVWYWDGHNHKFINENKK